jgi:hypothetical protein
MRDGGDRAYFGDDRTIDEGWVLEGEKNGENLAEVLDGVRGTQPECRERGVGGRHAVIIRVGWEVRRPHCQAPAGRLLRGDGLREWEADRSRRMNWHAANLSDHIIPRTSHAGIIGPKQESQASRHSEQNRKKRRDWLNKERGANSPEPMKPATEN